MENMLDHYNAVMRDLEQRISRCEQEMRGYRETLSQIRKLASAQTSLFVSAPTSNVPSVAVSQARYSGMSVRWAILCLLAEDAPKPLGTGEIARILTDGGITSRGAKFSSNVSAVLSGMKTREPAPEVEDAENGGYRLTQHGRDVWNGIKLTAQYQNRLSSAIVQ